MIWLAVAAAMGATATGFAARLALRAVAREETAQLRLGLRAFEPDAQGGQELSSGVGAFIRQLKGESREMERVELLRERLAEVDWETWGVAGRIGAWARVALFSGSAAAMAQLSTSLAASDSERALFAVLPFACGLLFAFGCHWMGRVAGAATEERRRAWDALSAAALRPLCPERPVRIPRDGTVSRHSSRRHEQQQVKVR